jgi:hypothetical protein
MCTPAIDPGSTTHHLCHFLKFIGRLGVRPWTAVDTLCRSPFDRVRRGQEGGRIPLGYLGAILLKNNVAFPPIDGLLGSSLISPMFASVGSFVQWRMAYPRHCQLPVTHSQDLGLRRSVLSVVSVLPHLGKGDII